MMGLRVKVPLFQCEPPFANGVAALEAELVLLQSPAPYLTQPGAEHGASYLPNEFVFVRSIEI